MMTIMLWNGPCHGEWWQVDEFSRIHWRHPNGRHERYRNSGQIDAATGYAIFIYAPRQGQA